MVGRSVTQWPLSRWLLNTVDPLIPCRLNYPTRLPSLSLANISGYTPRSLPGLGSLWDPSTTLTTTSFGTLRCSSPIESVISTRITLVSMTPSRLLYSFAIHYISKSLYIIIKLFHLSSTLPSFFNLYLAEGVPYVNENDESSSFTESERESGNIPQPHESQLDLATSSQARTLNPETIHGFVPQVPQNPWTINPPTAMSGWNPGFGWENTQGGGGGGGTPAPAYPGETPLRQTHTLTQAWRERNLR